MFMRFLKDFLLKKRINITVKLQVFLKTLNSREGFFKTLRKTLFLHYDINF